MKRWIAAGLTALLLGSNLPGAGFSIAAAAQNPPALNPPAVGPAAPAPAPAVPPPPAVDAKAALLYEPRSGQILAQQNATEARPPASLAKLMTLRLTFKALAEGRVKKSDLVPISVRAWAQSTTGSIMFLEPNTKVPLEDLIRGIAVVSGNDACIAVAEYLGGSVDGFVAMMNDEAKRLGLTQTHFVDPHGLSPDNRVSALDLAKLVSIYINESPEALTYHSTKQFTYNKVTQFNRNHLLDTFPGADGLKTGFIDESGYNLVATAQRDGMRLIAIVLGVSGRNEAEGSAKREAEAAKLLSYGFNQFTTAQVLKAGQVIGTVPVYKGGKPQVPAVVGQDVFAVVPRGQEKKVQTVPSLPASLEAPVTKGQAIGKVEAKIPGRESLSVPAVAGEDVPRGGFFRVLWDSLRLWFSKLLGR